jgi:hypothetical protein
VTRALIEALLDLARFDRERGRPAPAIDYARRAVAVAPETGSRSWSRRSFDALVAGRELAGDYAGRSRRALQDADDRLAGDEKQKQLDVLEQKFQAERRPATPSGRGARQRCARWPPTAGACC